MKFARYGERGAEKPALVDANGNLRDLSAHVDDIAGDILTRLDDLKSIDPESLPLVEGNPRLGACVGQTGKFICIGLNYADHAAESGMEVPPEPVIFAKYTSAICGPNDPIIIPRGSEKTDWEVELGFVIGKKAKYVSEADALDHVAGFCLINDVSERAYQIERAGQWSKGKSSDNFGPTGPWLVTPDEVGDFDNLGMWLDVNGERVQDGSTATMVYRVPHLISYLSQFFTLHPGDIISTGTPPGVGLGFNPPRYLKAGDVVELGIDGLGTQRQVCVNDD
ncbi:MULTISPECIES: fumarylacetoacetate hydrolase family protein [Thalassospira]|uniref:FAA hydrolase family protein n=1 Tax=Thalassospira povalilytica TaxID=732237 RepID=A0A8I1SIS8_9PROT|nr:MULTISPECIES: fumarylacetoacetate hydrolase family protein [Thalassospira]MEE3046761.1 fumarylacetoacetate hydrolase family protein [Pseudomonadota bacterium]RCK22666.1 2-hydroxyhepta-2,4-diene-1,7-dioate isomerase [Thalassospira profundimaris]KZB59854.1 2-hydroxyhepta-2,4-diene-1,7-dioate isomerase [Thalassospira sp. MCCC 1A02491]MBN8196104.1 fumarylacetoacetate hydrolase family protein [Thalassospira povalilytica]MBO6772472.1 fumarylacetoacetate hydrolase family protein [Thalassospira sp.|tara:strand:+ start:687 stop:1526 length:840 start_codon:yes stop_codon:yes gene_type:complete